MAESGYGEPVAHTPEGDQTTVEADTKLKGADAGKQVSTPFGVFTVGSEAHRSVRDVVAASEMQAYFMTHAPAEWLDYEEVRNEFCSIYGEQALAIAVRHKTVPENMDPMWVTKGAVAGNAT